MKEVQHWSVHQEGDLCAPENDVCPRAGLGYVPMDRSVCHGISSLSMCSIGLCANRSVCVPPKIKSVCVQHWSVSHLFGLSRTETQVCLCDAS